MKKNITDTIVINRLKELKEELNTGHQLMQKLESDKQDLTKKILMITGAIQGFEELLNNSESRK